MNICVKQIKMPRKDFLQHLPLMQTNTKWLKDISNSYADKKEQIDEFVSLLEETTKDAEDTKQSYIFFLVNFNFNFK